MAIEIEILDTNPQTARIALYYPVPVEDQLDPNLFSGLTPSGTRLSAGELTQFQNGEITEFISTVSINGMDKSTARTRVESEWSNRQVDALNSYKSKYRDADFIGLAFNGASWS